MSRTLKLVDRLLARGRHFQALGREHDALRVLERLACIRELPAAVAEEAQARLAEIQLARQNFSRARRHLTAALLYKPCSAGYHARMAAALDADDQGDPRRAAEHYSESLHLDPDQPQVRADFGLLALRQGNIEEGLDALRQAVGAAPDDPVIVGKAVEGLRQEGRSEEIRRLLLAARFRNPRDVRFQKLWDDFQFHQLRERQEAGRCRDAAGAGDAPVLLPFVRPAPGSSASPAAGKRIRRDAPSAPPPPHFPTRPAHLPDRRHA
jgi:tetratricopeptide (TPR) repeat protein